MGEGNPVVDDCIVGGGNRVNEERDEMAELGESGAILLLLLLEDDVDDRTIYYIIMHC